MSPPAGRKPAPVAAWRSQPGSKGVRLSLSMGMSENLRTRPIFDGRVRPQGIELICTSVHASELFWRQLRFGDFDISEMSLSSLMAAVAAGDNRWVGLPIFTTR